MNLAAGMKRNASRISTPLYHRMLLGILLAGLIALCVQAVVAKPDLHRWTDNELVESYRGLESRGELNAAVLSPTLPKESSHPAFLDALAWFAAGTPKGQGILTIERLDGFIQSQVLTYIHLLRAKVERNEENDYARTRTWKVVQKLTILREEMSHPARNGRYSYPAISQTPSGDDPWEQEHTLGSLDEFKEKVCRASYTRPVLVKFGNTNCTQCMLFEMTGSVKEFAEHPSHRGAVDIYKVWWGLQPDASFAGKIRDPERLNELVETEGVWSSPYFIVYRNGRRYPCENAFLDHNGTDERLESCVRQEFGETPVADVCASR